MTSFWPVTTWENVCELLQPRKLHHSSAIHVAPTPALRTSPAGQFAQGVHAYLPASASLTHTVTALTNERVSLCVPSTPAQRDSDTSRRDVSGYRDASARHVHATAPTHRYPRLLLLDTLGATSGSLQVWPYETAMSTESENGSRGSPLRFGKQSREAMAAESGPDSLLAGARLAERSS